jgi:hypothetical protein
MMLAGAGARQLRSAGRVKRDGVLRARRENLRAQKKFVKPLLNKKKCAISYATLRFGAAQIVTRC